MINKFKNFFGKFDSRFNKLSNDPDKKPWELPALMSFLSDYPNMSSMKNHKVLEILRDNRKLTKEIEVLKGEVESWNLCKPDQK